ncbi:hypothetical protein PPL_08866 [Heterostelium album PN500]|uniref:ER membrane protein complex subunit 7 beta-sandwich domain-containing protein n=1 Tax=Heterostelium pallidum (strain ATCC 26659 / Pp 5 / PN500) TaxID=670386 RepID=D3BJY6_HETP5|nr:hypothetical protein PPL_08866 [Heterostelium album PN500]EFA78216.1 hypothetical protein PPL_08866 [Heterostelium album PN500]|eukprot:XP_020430342.1 hypothetical protein PPL_08866 [Heterostelium album PN500]
MNEKKKLTTGNLIYKTSLTPWASDHARLIISSTLYSFCETIIFSRFDRVQKPEKGKIDFGLTSWLSFVFNKKSIESEILAWSEAQRFALLLSATIAISYTDTIGPPFYNCEEFCQRMCFQKPTIEEARLYVSYQSTFINKLDGKLSFGVNKEYLDAIKLDNIRLRLIDNVDENNIVEQIPNVDGQFSFVNIPTGSYILDVDSKDYVFRQMKVDVSKQRQVRVRNDNDTVVQSPITMKPVGLPFFFEKHAPFSIWGLFKSPMIIMMGITGILIVVMPMMTNAIENDEETKEAFKQSGPELIQSVPDWPTLSITKSSGSPPLKDK